MKLLFAALLLCALLLCALPVGAQPDPPERVEPIVVPVNGLPFPLFSPGEVQKAVARPFAIRLRDATLFEALQELQKQSGVELDQLWGGRSSLEKKLSLDLETTSVTRAFDEIMDEADVKATLESYGRERTWSPRFYPKEAAPQPPQSGVGLFQVQAVSIDAVIHKQVRLGQSDSSVHGQGEEWRMILQTQCATPFDCYCVKSEREKLGQKLALS